MRRTATAAQRRRSGEILPWAERTRCAGWDGGHGARTLVRAVTGGAEVRAVGGGPGSNSGHASTEAEDRPPGCSTLAQVAGGRSLSARVGPKWGESGPAPTALAPASTGADADAGHESVAGHRHERRGAAQERTVEQARAKAVGVVLAGSLGHTTPSRSVGVAGPIKPEHPRVKHRHRARSRATARGETADDPSGCRAPHRTGLCVDHRVSGAVSLWQADRQLPRARPLRGLQRRSPAARTYQQTRQRSAAILAGGGG